MGVKSIYTYYKERLVEISGRNRCLYMRSFSKKNGYDVGGLVEGNERRAAELIEFLWRDGGGAFTLLAKSERESLSHVFGIDDKTFIDRAIAADGGEDKTKAATKGKRAATEAFNKALEKEIADIAALKREIEEIEKETGRYELFVGYPFVCGAVKDTVLKAPLLLFPVELEIEDGVSAGLRIKKGSAIELNKAFLLAYAQAKRLNVSEITTEFDSLTESSFNDVGGLVRHLKGLGVDIAFSHAASICNFRRAGDPSPMDAPRIVPVCMLARFPLSGSIYNDYTELEKSNLMTDGIAELLNTKKDALAVRIKRTRKTNAAPDGRCYFISDVDFAQRAVVEKVSRNGNAVVYGPPGTGKSQTIVNLISDAVCKNKRVLVVSQKKAALDVVFNRLGRLNAKTMLVADPAKERKYFYDRCLTRHSEVLSEVGTESAYGEITARLEAEIAKLEQLSATFSVRSTFGLNLIEMYSGSFIPGKKGGEIGLFRGMQADKQMMKLDYLRLSPAVETLLEADKAELYYRYVEEKKNNPFFEHIRAGLANDALATAKANLERLLGSRAVIFDGNEFFYARAILANYASLADKRNERLLIRTLTAFAHPAAYRFLQTSKILFPLYPLAKLSFGKKENGVRLEYERSKAALADFLSEYDFLRDILTDEGFAMATDGIVGGNSQVVGKLLAALSNYAKVTDVRLTLARFTADEKTVLAYAYKNTNNFESFKTAVAKSLPIRIYCEIISFEDNMREALSKTSDFDTIRVRILALIRQQQEESKKIFMQAFGGKYREMFAIRSDSRDYLYQISKKQSYWSLRRVMDNFSDYLLTLFPCWLMSPENVSTVLPLKKEMFDLVLFDEASQVLIESTLPAILRGKNIVVAGDGKQLRPTTTFMRRYMGGETDDDTDLSMQAALEVESLLDLAVARYEAANITYHYRSASRELIDFSNHAFYNSTLRISPNVARASAGRAITRQLVNGRWIDRRNEAEGEAVVALVKKLFKTRKNGETVGIITFNAEQQACIEDMLSAECRRDDAFRSRFIKESGRTEDGQDVSLFVKNIENVQGDERDIIIFSVGYAANESGKVTSHFGSLSQDGGENRLNVAITRAKKKIYVITSIEPEDLKVDGAKNDGPKLFRWYLSYARAVSAGRTAEADTILAAVSGNSQAKNAHRGSNVAKQIAAKLTVLGYTVDTGVGSGRNAVSLAVFDEKSEKYTLGVQIDADTLAQSDSPLERDVFAQSFLEQKGWQIMRVWSRDWWHNADGVVQSIVNRL